MRTKRRLLPTLFIALFGLACGADFESVCNDFCDKGVECGGIEGSADLAECRSDCAESEREAQRLRERGQLDEACYDAGIDFLSCATGLSCMELTGDDLPPECADEFASFENLCDT